MSLKSRIHGYLRVLKITKKPTKDEFLSSSKVTGLGLLLIGAIGFVVYFMAKMSGLF